MEFNIEYIARLLLASLLGGIIGIEREVHGRAAGFRTHLLVALGSCLFVVTSIHFYEQFGNTSGIGPVGVDPARVAAQVVTGIGFLGAGAIMRDKASIRGLTTAACLWIAAAIGLACGIGLYFIAPFVTLLAVISLLLLKKVENLLKRDTYSSVKIWSEGIDNHLIRIEELLGGFGLQLMNAIVEKDVSNRETFIAFEIKLSNRDIAYELFENIATIPGVKKVRIE
ncbi:MAG: magnesium transporter MgtC [Geobacteraceae bacterium]|nr:magnesium transporter MgtC [Geobacteraceae bacterium]